MKTLLGLVLLLIPVLAHSQDFASDVVVNASAAKIIFQFQHKDLKPSNYEITLDSNATLKYVSRETANDPEPFATEFRVSDDLYARVFELAKKLDYFANGLAAKHKVAYMGDKTLIYLRDDVRNQSSFNYSDSKDAQELARIFQAIAATQEGGRRLDYLRKYEKLGLDEELKNLERSSVSRTPGLEELHSIAPALKAVSEDRGVMRMARERAKRLLALAQGVKP